MTLLTTRRQKQALRNVLSKMDPGLDPEYLDDEYYYLFGFITDYQSHGYNFQTIYQELMRLRLSNTDLSNIIDDILSLEPGKSLEYRSLEDIGPELNDVTFFWENWLPRGYLTMLAAWPGVGKTYLACDLARLILAGEPAPDGEPFGLRSRNIIYVDAEDLLPEIWKRAKAWGMDSSTFYTIRRPPRELLDLADPVYQDDLIDMCYDLRPDLLIVDSFSMAHLGGENTVEDVRQVLMFLDEVARAFDLAEIIIHHPRKPPPGLTQPITMHDLRGSGLLLAISRSILGMDVVRSGPDDDPNGPRRLRVLKTNFGLFPKPLAVHFNSIPGTKKAALVYSQSEFYTPIAATQTDECARWIPTVLADENLAYKDLKEMAAELGYGENILQDARKLLGNKIIDTVGPRRRGNKWALRNGSNSEAT